jgi:hypothetical protein
MGRQVLPLTPCSHMQRRLGPEQCIRMCVLWSLPCTASAARSSRLQQMPCCWRHLLVFVSPKAIAFMLYPVGGGCQFERAQQSPGGCVAVGQRAPFSQAPGLAQHSSVVCLLQAAWGQVCRMATRGHLWACQVCVCVCQAACQAATTQPCARPRLVRVSEQAAPGL